MTHRERREARAERLRGWAGKRDEKAKAATDKAREIADIIPFGQPVLSGHHSQGRHMRDLDRIHNGYRKGFEHQAKAEGMRNKADNIDSQLDRSIYSDDPDAIERLAERVADLEAERDRVKRYNATCRKGSPDLSILDDDQKRELASCISTWGDVQCKGGIFPGYHLKNLSANTNRNRKRLAELQAVASNRWRESS